MKRPNLYTGLFIFSLIFLASCVSSLTHFMGSLNLSELKDGTYIGKDRTLLCSVKVATTVKEGKVF